jgi:parvulin-like peptidyl-prolyl isomerase
MPEVNGLDTLQDKALTPDKKDQLVNQIQSEIDSLNRILREQGAPAAVLEAAKRNKNSLQGLVNKILAKKGVITPTETNDALEAMAKAKRERLESDFSTTVRRFAIVAGLLIGGYLAWRYVKKLNQNG